MYLSYLVSSVSSVEAVCLGEKPNTTQEPQFKHSPRRRQPVNDYFTLSVDVDVDSKLCGSSCLTWAHTEGGVCMSVTVWSVKTRSHLWRTCTWAADMCFYTHYSWWSVYTFCTWWRLPGRKKKSSFVCCIWFKENRTNDGEHSTYRHRTSVQARPWTGFFSIAMAAEAHGYHQGDRLKNNLDFWKIQDLYCRMHNKYLEAVRNTEGSKTLPEPAAPRSSLWMVCCTFSLPSGPILHLTVIYMDLAVFLALLQLARC